MDLTRMMERATAKATPAGTASSSSGAGGGDARCYTSIGAFLTDIGQMVHNAKFFNCPPQQVPVYHATKRFPHPSTLPAEQVPPASVYAMAFDLEAVALAMQPALTAEWEAAVFTAKRGMYDAVMALSQGGGAGGRW